MAEGEHTYIMVKPDGVQRGFIGEIIKRFEKKRFKLVAMKFMQVNYIAVCVLMYFHVYPCSLPKSFLDSITVLSMIWVLS